MITQQSKTQKTEAPVINLAPNDQILDSNEASKFLKIKKKQVYQLTHQKKLKYFKPSHRCIIFLKSDLLQYMLGNPISTRDEIEKEAINIYNNLKI